MVALGADWVKTTHSDVHPLLHDLPVFDDACFEALVDEARSLDRPVMMHQTRVSGFRKAIELGVGSMEHAPLDALSDEAVGRIVDAGTPIVPTMRVFRENLLLDRLGNWLVPEGETYLCPDWLRPSLRRLEACERAVEEGAQPDPGYASQIPVMMENVGRLHAAGATVGFGTDSGGNEFSVFGRFFEEIDNLVEVGMSAFEALRSATAVNARILRLDDELGTLEPGKLADFVVLDGDPLRDTTALRRVRIVVKAGRVLHRDGM
jgi:imidazolonepropionase-like amidohydrolase